MDRKLKSFSTPSNSASPPRALKSAIAVAIAVGLIVGTRPGDDFFRYSNGGWFDHAVIAPDHDTNSIDTFLSDIAEARIRDILMSGATSVEPSAREDATKIGVFYHAAWCLTERPEGYMLGTVARDIAGLSFR
jgi:putative endopeptidase